FEKSSWKPPAFALTCCFCNSKAHFATADKTRFAQTISAVYASFAKNYDETALRHSCRQLPTAANFLGESTQRRTPNGKKTRSQKNSPRLLRRARHLHHPQVAEERVRLRGHHLFRRSRPG